MLQWISIWFVAYFSIVFLLRASFFLKCTVGLIHLWQTWSMVTEYIFIFIYLSESFRIWTLIWVEFGLWFHVFCFVLNLIYILFICLGGPFLDWSVFLRASHVLWYSSSYWVGRYHWTTNLMILVFFLHQELFILSIDVLLRILYKTCSWWALNILSSVFLSAFIWDLIHLLVWLWVLNYPVVHVGWWNCL